MRPTTEYTVHYSYIEEFPDSDAYETEVLWARTKDYAIALSMIDEIKERMGGTIPKTINIFIREVRTKEIKREMVS